MSRSCRRIDDSLPAYRDAALSGRRLRQVEGHLGACPECRQKLADLDRATAALERLRPVPPPAGMLDAFHARLASERPFARPAGIRWHRPGWLAPGLAAAAALAAVLCLRAAVPSGGNPQAPLVAEGRRGRPAPLTTERPHAARIVAGADVPRAMRTPAAAVHAREWRRAPGSGTRVAVRPVRRDAPAAGAPAVRAPRALSTPAPLPVRAAPEVAAAERAQATAAAPTSARVQITAQTVALVDFETGESRQILVARTVDSRTGQVHVTLSNATASAAESEGMNDG